MRAPRLRPRAASTAVVAAVLVALAACGRGGGGGGDGRPTGPAIDYHRPGAPTEVGTGSLVEMSLDGSAAYIQEEDPRFPEPGCEGQPEPVMFRLPLAGGEREVLGAGQEPLNGDLVRGKGRRVALISNCERFFERLFVGAETADGRLIRLKEVNLSTPDTETPPAPDAFAWSVDGKHLLAAENEFAEVGKGRAFILRTDPSTGVSNRIFEVSESAGVGQVNQLADGTYVLAGDQRVTLHNERGAVKTATRGNGFAISADRKRIAAFGSALVLITPGGAEPAVLVSPEKDRQITSAEFSPDGRAIAYISSVSSVNTVEIVTPADKKVTRLAGPGALGRAFFSGDGKSIAFNSFGGEGDNFVARLLLVRFGG